MWVTIGEGGEMDICFLLCFLNHVFACHVWGLWRDLDFPEELVGPIISLCPQSKSGQCSPEKGNRF